MKRWTFYVTLSSYNVLNPTGKFDCPIDAENYDDAVAKANRVADDIRAELAGTNQYMSRGMLSGACVEVAA